MTEEEASLFIIMRTGLDSSGSKPNPSARYSIYQLGPNRRELSDEFAKEKAPPALWSLLVDMRSKITVDLSGDDPEVGVVSNHRQGLQTGNCIIAETRFGRRYHKSSWGVAGDWQLGIGLGSGSVPHSISPGAAASLAPAITRYFTNLYKVAFSPMETPQEEESRLQIEAAQRNEQERKAAALAREETEAREAQAKADRKEQAIRSVATILGLDEGVSKTLLNEILLAIA